MQIRNETPVDAGAIEAVTIAAFEHAPQPTPPSTSSCVR